MMSQHWVCTLRPYEWNIGLADGRSGALRLGTVRPHAQEARLILFAFLLLQEPLSRKPGHRFRTRDERLWYAVGNLPIRKLEAT